MKEPKRLKRLKRVSKAELPQRLADALGSSIKTIDAKLSNDLEALNRTQLRAGEISREQGKLYDAAMVEMERRFNAVGADAGDIRKELSDLRADVSQTTARLLDYISAKMTVEEGADEDDDCTPAIYAVIEEMKEQFNRLEEYVASRMQRFLTGPIGGTTDVAVFGEDDDGNPVLVNNDVKSLRFRGDDVEVVPVQGERGVVDVYVPPQGDDLANILRVPYVNETQIAITDITGYPLVQNFSAETQLFVPSAYAEIVYGFFDFDAVTPAAAKLVSNEEAEPAYVVRYIPEEQIVLVNFDTPRSGTLVISY